MKEGIFTAGELARLGEAAGLTQPMAVNCIRRYTKLGVIVPAGWTTFNHAPAFAYDRATGAVALVLTATAQWSGINDEARLRGLAEHLMADSGEGVPLIQRVLDDIDGDGLPALAVVICTLRKGPPKTVFAVRLGDERADPVKPPKGAVSYMAGAIELSPLLLPLVAAMHTEKARVN